MEFKSTAVCPLCGKNFWGIPGDNCMPCEGIIRSWAAKGFLDLCRYLEKVSMFEEFLASSHQASSDDPAPAVDE